MINNLKPFLVVIPTGSAVVWAQNGGEKAIRAVYNQIRTEQNITEGYKIISIKPLVLPKWL